MTPAEGPDHAAVEPPVAGPRRRGLLARLLLGAVGLYRRFISPLSPPRCRFYPSCSSYAVIAIETHGPVRGTGLAVWRVLRCNPWNSGGVDDVPGTGPGAVHDH